MAKGPIINSDARGLIATVYLQNPKWRAKEVQLEVSTQLHNENPKLPPDWPGLSIVQKELAKIRKNDTERTPESKELDEPWSIGSLIDHPISAEAIPKVLELKRIYKESKAIATFTIRTALWAGRLYSLSDDVNYLAVLSTAYALEERSCELTSTEINTVNLDNTLLIDPVMGFIDYANNLTNILEEKVLFEINQMFRKALEDEVEIDSEETEHWSTKRLVIYVEYLRMMSISERWQKLAKEERKKNVIALRDCINKLDTKEHFMALSELLNEFVPGYGDNLNRLVNESLHIEEVENERTHNQEG